MKREGGRGGGFGIHDHIILFDRMQLLELNTLSLYLKLFHICCALVMDRDHPEVRLTYGSPSSVCWSGQYFMACFSATWPALSILPPYPTGNMLSRYDGRWRGKEIEGKRSVRGDREFNYTACHISMEKGKNSFQCMFAWVKELRNILLLQL